METKYILSEKEFHEFSVSSAYCEIILKMELQRQADNLGKKDYAPSMTDAQRILINEMDLHQLLNLLGVLAENIEKLPDKGFVKSVIARIGEIFSK
jgi:hypothetical protein